MELNEIFKLIDAGYTKADIEKMDAPKDEPPKDEPPKDELPKDEPPKDDVTINISEYTKNLESKLDELVATVGKLQADNIDKADAGEPEPAPTIEELVANFTKDM